MRGEDGLAVIALGLGRQVAGGLQAVRFSPVHPRHIPAFSSVPETLQNSQTQFWALDMSHPHQMPSFEETATLLHLDLDEALRDGTLPHVASTYSPENDRIYEGLRENGYPVVTFAPILSLEVFPLAKILHDLLELSEAGMGSPVEMEFALDLRGGTPYFGFLQLRRLVAGGEPEDVRLHPRQIEEAICYSEAALGNGRMDEIRDVVYVRPEAFDAAHSREIAQHVGNFNRSLLQEGRPYLLIGPGRWGSSDPWLGIPVTWDQISGVRTIVEASLPDFRVTPSQGTHFFQNMTSLRIAYFTVNPYGGEDRIDWEWLERHAAAGETDFVRLLRFERPIRIRVEGKTNRGVILGPAPDPPPSDSNQP
jgi:hypothetical protein